jgi:pyruvate kinase
MTLNGETENRRSTVQRLQQEIEALTEEHTQALRAAIYLGITPAVAQEHDQRRDKIQALVERLAVIRSRPSQ